MSTVEGEVAVSFAELARSSLEHVLERNPHWATTLGDHRFDALLADERPEALEEARTTYAADLAALSRIERGTLSPEDRADALILENTLLQLDYELEELRECEWNPMAANPGRALYELISRDFAPLRERLDSLAGRLGAIPEALHVARSNLKSMPRVHLETAIGQFAGTEHLLEGELARLVEDERGARSRVEGVLAVALEALGEHRRFLEQQLAEHEAAASFRSPRLGAERFARKLALTLEAETEAGAIAARAETDLARISEEITELAESRTGGRARGAAAVREALDACAREVPDDATILEFARAALEHQTAFVEDQAVVRTYHDPVEVISMPEIDRGVAVAYCDPPGPLETAAVPTFVAVSPTPADWTPQRVASFYREYNRHLVQDLMIHEAMPGHVLQLQHSRRFSGSSPLRAAFYSGSFVEGWAVYAEKLMAELGYPGEGDAGALRLQQLKMQLRMTINAILDAAVHCDGLEEQDAMALMTGRGFQEEGEAAGKWRRALLTSAQLSTYYVGFSEVSDLVDDLRRARPGAPRAEIHNALLAHGSPAVRHLRTLLF